MKSKDVVEDAMFALNFSRHKIPYSNISKVIIEIESGYLPDEFMYEVGKLIPKYAQSPTKAHNSNL